MLDSQAYIARAIAAGPAGFDRILVEGANAYAQSILDLINRSPHDDLPLILATLRVSAKALASDINPPFYVDLLVDSLELFSKQVVIKARVPKTGGET